MLLFSYVIHLRSGVDLILFVVNPHPRTAGLLRVGDQAQEGEESRDSDGISGLLRDGDQRQQGKEAQQGDTPPPPRGRQQQRRQQLGGHREMSLSLLSLALVGGNMISWT